MRRKLIIEKRRKKRKKIKNHMYLGGGVALIIAGMGLLIFPSLQQRSYDVEQQRIREEFRESVCTQPRDPLQNGVEEYYAMNCPPERNTVPSEEAPPPETFLPESSDFYASAELDKEQLEEWPVEAVLIIEKIDLFLPIIEGDSEEHLDVSVASLENQGKPWEKNSNYAIAGHRSRSYGRHFNRLGELNLRDKVEIVDRHNNLYSYQVYSKEIVYEKETSILENRNRSEVTLITCHPMEEDNPSTRLVIKAKRVKEEKNIPLHFKK